MAAFRSRSRPAGGSRGARSRLQRPTWTGRPGRESRTPAARKVLPSGETARSSTRPLNRAMTLSSRPEDVSQRRTVPSSPPVKTVPSAGETASERMAERWPEDVKASRPVATSQSRITGSLPVEASIRPSGENDIDVIISLMRGDAAPLAAPGDVPEVDRCDRVLAGHPPPATIVPSGEKARRPIGSARPGEGRSAAPAGPAGPGTRAGGRSCPVARS